jgi:hypothetical protein
MTSLKRIDALLAGRPMDRIPHFPFLLGFCAKNMGYPISTIREHGREKHRNLISFISADSRADAPDRVQPDGE